MTQLVFAFDKLDGSNIRAEWSKKRGFYKFGKRHGLVDESDSMLGKAKTLIQERYSEQLSKILTDRKHQSSVCFFEYYGPNSFAGSHDPNDSHEVTLIDVSVDKKGIIEPQYFLKHYTEQGVKTARVLHAGIITPEFVESVTSGKLEGMTFEGVVCKGTYVSPGKPLMFKIKNRAWIQKLKTKCNGDVQMILRLL